MQNRGHRSGFSFGGITSVAIGQGFRALWLRLLVVDDKLKVHLMYETYH